MTIFVLELLRRGYDVYVGKIDNAEIDFIATKQENKLYIQVTQEIDSAQTEQREYGRLLDIRDNYPKYVLRTDAFAGGNYQGIKTMHIADYQIPLANPCLISMSLQRICLLFYLFFFICSF